MMHWGHLPSTQQHPTLSFMLVGGSASIVWHGAARRFVMLGQVHLLESSLALVANLGAAAMVRMSTAGDLAFLIWS